MNHDEMFERSKRIRNYLWLGLANAHHADKYFSELAKVISDPEIKEKIMNYTDTLFSAINELQQADQYMANLLVELGYDIEKETEFKSLDRKAIGTTWQPEDK